MAWPALSSWWTPPPPDHSRGHVFFVCGALRRQLRALLSQNYSSNPQNCVSGRIGDLFLAGGIALLLPLLDSHRQCNCSSGGERQGRGRGTLGRTRWYGDQQLDNHPESPLFISPKQSYTLARKREFDPTRATPPPLARGQRGRVLWGQLSLRLRCRGRSGESLLSGGAKALVLFWVWCFIPRNGEIALFTFACAHMHVCACACVRARSACARVHTSVFLGFPGGNHSRPPSILPGSPFG